MALNKWDEETAIRNRNAVDAAYEAHREWYDFINDGYHRYFLDEYLSDGRMDSIYSMYSNTTSDLLNLREALTAYIRDYNGMLNESQAQMDSVNTENDVYGTLGGLIAADIAYTTMGYNTSSAYQFYNSGMSFASDYNDLYDFLSSDEYGWAEGLYAASEISDYLEHYAYFLSGEQDLLVEQYLENSLESVLTDLPGYQQIDTGNFHLVDWGALEEELGADGLEEAIKTLIKAINTFVDDEKLGTGESIADELINDAVSQLNQALINVDGGSEIVNSFMEMLSEAQFFLEVGGKLASTGLKFASHAEFATNLLYHVLSNHSMQVEYLDSVAASLELYGATSGSLYSKIEELKRLYADKEAYFIHELGDKICSEVQGSLLDSVNSLPVIGAMSTVYDLVGGVVTMAAGDDISAVEDIMGLQQYSMALTNSFEHYMGIIDAGVADAEDIKAADNLFEVLRVTKMKEYAAIKEIAPEGSDWYELAERKYKELEELKFSIANSQSGGGGGRF